MPDQFYIVSDRTVVTGAVVAGLQMHNFDYNQGY